MQCWSIYSGLTLSTNSTFLLQLLCFILPRLTVKFLTKKNIVRIFCFKSARPSLERVEASLDVHLLEMYTEETNRKISPVLRNATSLTTASTRLACENKQECYSSSDLKLVVDMWDYLGLYFYLVSGTISFHSPNGIV